MIALYLSLRRSRRAFRIVLLVTISVTLAILLVPKPIAPAATVRFLLLILLGLTLSVGGAAFFITGRRLREDRLRLRYAGAPAPMVAARHFLEEERRQASAGMAGATVLTVVTGTLFLASAWPQAAALAPLRPLIGAGALASCAAIAILPLWHRQNLVNAFFLAAFLRQQARFAGYTPVTGRAANRRLAVLEGPAVTGGGGTFSAGGFSFEFQDFTKGCLIQGQPGSGKTTILNTFLEGFFLMFKDSPDGFGFLVEDVQSDFRGKVERLAARYGRSDDLRIFDLHADPNDAGSDRAIIFNFVQSDDPPLEIADSFIACARMMGAKANDTFFQGAARDLIASSIVMLRAGLPPDDVPSVHHLYHLAHENPRPVLVSPDGEVIEPQGPPILFERLCAGLARLYPDRAAVPAEVANAIDYFDGEYYPMPDRQRAGVSGVVSQLLSELMRAPAAPFVTGRSTVSISEIVDRGLLLYVHAPLAHNPRVARIINTLIRLQYYNAVRRRREKPVPTLFLADEFHNLFLPGPDGDSQFFSLSRQCNHANIIAVQNLPLVFQVAARREEVFSLIGVCATQVYLRNSEPETNEAASKMFGEMQSITVSQSEPARFGHIFRRMHTSYSRASAKMRVIPADRFATLAVPVRDDPERNYTQSLIHLGTRAAPMRLDLLWKLHPL